MTFTPLNVPARWFSPLIRSDHCGILPQRRDGWEPPKRDPRQVQILMAQKAHIRYPLGSAQRSLELSVLLVAPFFVVYVLAPLVSRKVLAPLALRKVLPPLVLRNLEFGPPDFLVLAFLQIALLSFIFFGEGTKQLPWLDYLADNLAYGWAEDDGIHFRKWFRRRFVSWRGIQRLEYWPDRGRRIDLHLYSEASSVVFMPQASGWKERDRGDAGSDTLDYIYRKLEEAWPGRSTFLICYERPGHTNYEGLRRHKPSLRIKAFLTAGIILLILLLSYVFVTLAPSIP
jgi:hypothetical protein